MTRRHIPELDGVRGLACLLVIILHVVIAPLPLFPGTWFDLARFRTQPFMSGGVDLFFILSGFLISGALMDSKGAPGYFRSFWTRRIARIFPVYYVLICFSILARAVNDVRPTAVLQTLTNSSLPEGYFAIFSQNIVMALTKNNGNAILGVTWSLAIEEQFYLVFPFLVFLVPRRWLIVAAITAILSTPVIRALVVDSVDWNAGYLLTIARMDALMLGVLLASLVRHGPSLAIAKRWQRPLNWLALCLIGLQLGGFWGEVGEMWRLSLGRYTIYLMLICVQYPLLNLAMACLLLNVFTRETGPMRWVLKSKALSAVGLISYGAYMYHQSINFALWRWLYNTEPLYKGWEYGYVPLLVLGLTGVVALASYNYLEIPLRNRIKAAAKPRGYGIATSGDINPA